MVLVAVKMGEGGGWCNYGCVSVHVCCRLARGLNNTRKGRGRGMKRRTIIQYNSIIVWGAW